MTFIKLLCWFVALFGPIGLSLGAAGYHVAEANNEERSIKVRMKEELDAALKAEKEASEQESAIQVLELKAQEEQSTVASLNAQLEEARKRVVTLEADSKSAMEKSVATLDQIDKGRICLRSLLAQAAKHRETAEVCI